MGDSPRIVRPLRDDRPPCSSTAARRWKYLVGTFLQYAVAWALAGNANEGQLLNIVIGRRNGGLVATEAQQLVSAGTRALKKALGIGRVLKPPDVRSHQHEFLEDAAEKFLRRYFGNDFKDRIRRILPGDALDTTFTQARLSKDW